MALNEGQLVTYALDEIIETVQNPTPMASKATKYPSGRIHATFRSNTVWMPIEQEAPTQTGWDLTGNATGILELSVEMQTWAIQITISSSFVQMTCVMSVLTVAASSIRQKLANNIESAIAKQVTEMGSLCCSRYPRNWSIYWPVWLGFLCLMQSA